MPSFFDKRQKEITLAVHDYRQHSSVHTFTDCDNIESVTEWITKKGFAKVVLLSNQSGLLSDSLIGRRLRQNGIQVACQSHKAASLGSNKIEMKKFLQAEGFPTPPFRSVNTLTEAIRAARDIGFPALLKVSDLSDGRKMSIVKSDDDIARYYYQNAIREPVIVEKHISGREISTIVYHNFGNPVVFPVIYKPTTDYLLKGKSVNTRIYIAPHPDIAFVEKEIQDLALALSSQIENEFLLGLDIVLENSSPYIVEFNARIIETLRMSMLLTKYNVFQSMITAIPLVTENAYLPPREIVVDFPFPSEHGQKVTENLRLIRVNFVLGATRATLCGESLDELITHAEQLTTMFETQG